MSGVDSSRGGEGERVSGADNVTWLAIGAFWITGSLAAEPAGRFDRHIATPA
jgi:hypothetical protein